MEFHLLTLHPDLVKGPLEGSILGRAQRTGLFRASVYDIRDHGLGRHKTVDDSPYGGGAGMVMRVDVVVEAIEAVRRPESKVFLMSPGGRTLVQVFVKELAREEHSLPDRGHYEGVDARVLEHVDGEISLGGFVLTGGELPAVAVVDSVARLLPGVLGNSESAVEESFSAGGLEHPQYTRPVEFRGSEVPEVLRGGNHGAIAAWRREAAERRTAELRPDLVPDPAENADESHD